MAELIGLAGLMSFALAVILLIIFIMIAYNLSSISKSAKVTNEKLSNIQWMIYKYSSDKGVNYPTKRNATLKELDLMLECGYINKWQHKTELEKRAGDTSNAKTTN